VEVAQLGDLVGIRPVPVLARDLEDGRETLEAWVGEEHPELIREHAFADVRVPVPVGAELRSGVVDVERAEAVEADGLLDLVEARVERGGIRHVDAGHPEVAGVEADPDPGMAVETVHEQRQLLDRAADCAARAR